jgi:hypothetical protein
MTGSRWRRLPSDPRIKIRAEEMKQLGLELTGKLSPTLEPTLNLEEAE